MVEQENENIPAQAEFQANPEILDTIPEANEISQTLDEG